MLERRRQELDLIRAKYGEIEVSPNLDWVTISHFPLPSGWSKPDAKLLVLIPPGYATTPPDNFYVDNDLRLANGADPANTSRDQERLGQRWLMFSFHVEISEWRPHADLLLGHNLLTFLAGVEKRLSEAS